MGIGAFIGLDNCYIRCAEAGPPEGFERSGHDATKAPTAVGIVIIQWRIAQLPPKVNEVSRPTSWTSRDRVINQLSEV